MTTTAPLMARIGSVNVNRLSDRPVMMLSVEAWEAVKGAIILARATGSRGARTEHDGMVYEAEQFVGPVWIVFEGIKPAEPTFAERVPTMSADELLGAYAYACGAGARDADAMVRRIVLADEMKRRMV